MSPVRSLRLFRGRRGMTLIEVVFASAISAIISIGAVSVAVYQQRSTMKIYQLNQTGQEARVLGDHLTRDARMAVSLEASYLTFTAGDDTLILKVPSIDDDENIIDVDSSFDHIVYHLEDGGGPAGMSVLVRDVFPGAGSSRAESTVVIGDFITDSAVGGTFAVVPDALGVFVIHYQCISGQTLLGRTHETTISGSVRLRNKE